MTTTAPADRTRVRWSGRPDADAWWFWGPATFALVAILARNTWIFRRHVYEHGDAALISIMVQNSHHGAVLTGPVSRVGFPHPGPAYIYVVSAGQSLVHDWLPLTASAYGGQFAGAAVLQAVLFGLVVRVLVRLTGSARAGWIGGAIVFWFEASHRMLGETWLPYLYTSAFALLVIAMIAVAAGRTRELAALVLAGGLLAHGHVAFLMFVGISWLAAGLAWWFQHRGGARAELARERRSVLVAAGLLALFAVPLVAEVVLHYPGPWPDYLSYQGARHGRSVGTCLDFFGHFWADSYPGWLVPIAVLAGAVAWRLDPDRDRRRRWLIGYGVLALQSGLFLVYIVRGIDVLAPVNYYTGWFYETVPMFLLVLPAVQLALLVPARWTGPRLAGRVLPLAAVVVVAAGAASPALTEVNPDNPSVAPLLSALVNDPDRGGRTIVLRFDRDRWSLMASIVAEGKRRGVPICVADPYWRGLFTPSAICSDPAAGWAVASQAPGDYTGGHAVIWADVGEVVYEGVRPNLPPDQR